MKKLASVLNFRVLFKNLYVCFVESSADQFCQFVHIIVSGNRFTEYNKIELNCIVSTLCVLTTGLIENFAAAF